MSDQEVTAVTGAPAPEATAEEQGNPAVTAETPTEGKEQPPAKTFTQEELNEIVQKRVAKAEARAEKRVAQAYRESLHAVTRPEQAAQANEAPKREQFQTDEEWIDARLEHKLSKLQQQSQVMSQQQQAKQIEAKTQDIFAKAEKLGGFDLETFAELPVSQTMADAVLESDVAPQLVVYMQTNPDDVERIAKLSPARQAVELGKIEAKLQAAPKTTQTMPPISPIGAKGSASVSLGNASQKEYEAMRRKQGARY